MKRTIVQRLVAMCAVVMLAAGGLHAQSVMNLAIEAYNNHEYVMAMSYFNQVLANRPDDAYALAYKGALLRYDGENQQALEATTRSIQHFNTERDPQFGAWIYYQRGAINADLGDTVQAIADMGRAIELDPTDAQYFQDRAYLEYNSGKYHQAVEDAQQALTLNPDDAYNLEIMGRAYVHMHCYQDAIDAFSRAAVIDEVNAEYWNKKVEQLQRATGKSTAGGTRDTTAADQVVLPNFPGGKEGLREYVQQQLRYPEEATPGSTNKVLVDCLIDKAGNVADCRVLKSAGEAFDNEALRVCRQLPQFQPATVHGVPTQCWYQVNITFSISLPACSIPSERDKK